MSAYTVICIFSISMHTGVAFNSPCMDGYLEARSMNDRDGYIHDFKYSVKFHRDEKDHY